MALCERRNLCIQKNLHGNKQLSTWCWLQLKNKLDFIFFKDCRIEDKGIKNKNKIRKHSCSGQRTNSTIFFNQQRSHIVDPTYCIQLDCTYLFIHSIHFLLCENPLISLSRRDFRKPKKESLFPLKRPGRLLSVAMFDIFYCRTEERRESGGMGGS